MRKQFLIVILAVGLLASCQAGIENGVPNQDENHLTIVSEPNEIQPLITPTPESTFDINSKIGIVDVDSGGTTCLRSKVSDLAAGAPVSIIISLSEPPQKVLNATVEKKMDRSCSRYASETGDQNPGGNYFYSLKLIDSETNETNESIFDVGIGVIGPGIQIRTQNKYATIDLNNDGKPEYFRLCSGFEGMHFAIWTGKPLRGKRIWHSFYYVDYDTVPTCKKADWRDTGDGNENN
jgi:hypothetical protein